MPRQGLSHEYSMAIDPYANAVTIIGENHRMIHDGYFFTTWYRDASVANSGTIDIIFVVDENSYPHFQLLEVNLSEGNVTYELFEDTTVSANGTELSVFNRNRNKDGVSATKVYHTPTITDDGTLIDSLHIPTTGNNKAIFDESHFGEWVLKPDTIYLMRFTNEGGGAKDINIRMGGYEIGPDH